MAALAFVLVQQMSHGEGRESEAGGCLAQLGNDGEAEGEGGIAGELWGDFGRVPDPIQELIEHSLDVHTAPCDSGSHASTGIRATRAIRSATRTPGSFRPRS